MSKRVTARGTGQQRAPRPMSPDEVRRLATEVGPRYAALVYVAAECGLRYGECAGLRVRDLDLLRGALTVTQVVSEVNGRVRFERPKSDAANRTIAISSNLVQILAAHLATQGLTGADPDDVIFPAPKGGPLRYSNFRARVWVPALNRAGIEGAGTHDLRRTSATMLVALGVDLKTASVRLGHADVRLTLKLYAQPSAERDRDAAAQLGDLLAGEMEDGEAAAEPREQNGSGS